MKLLYLSGAPRVSTNNLAQAGGPRTHVLGVVKGFEMNGFKVDKAIAGDKLKIQSITAESASKLKEGRLLKLIADLLRIFYRFYFRFYFKKKYKDDYDFVYERLAAMQALGRPFNKKKIPWVLETNAPLFYEAVKERSSTLFPKVVKYFEFKAYRQCTYLVCVSEKLKEIILREVKLPENKVIVMPNGVDLDKFSSNLIVPKFSFKELTIGFVGTIQPWQKLDLLLEACVALRNTGIIIKIIIVGDGLDLERLKQLTSDLNITGQVIFTGRVQGDEVPSYIKSFDLGYSAPESMKVGLYVSPLKLYEYMASGVPALAAATEDALSIIKNGENGFLFKQNDVDGLKETIETIFDNRSKLKLIGENARATVIEKHSWQNRIKYLIDYIEKDKFDIPKAEIIKEKVEI